MASSVPDRRPNCRYSMNQPIQRIPTEHRRSTQHPAKGCARNEIDPCGEIANGKIGNTVSQACTIHVWRTPPTWEYETRKESTFIVSHAIVYFFRFSAFCILFSIASIVILIIETWIKIKLVFKKMHGSNLIDEKKQFVVDLFRFSKIFLLLERID